MAPPKKVTVIDAASKDKPAHVPLDPEQKMRLVITHISTGRVIVTWGWTLNQVLSIMGWYRDEVMATGKPKRSKGHGAVDMTPRTAKCRDLSELNDQ